MYKFSITIQYNRSGNKVIAWATVIESHCLFDASQKAIANFKERVGNQQVVGMVIYQFKKD
jgi:hypothetical protein